MKRGPFLLLLCLLLSLCACSGGRDQQKEYKIYYIAAELENVQGEDAIQGSSIKIPQEENTDLAQTAKELMVALLENEAPLGLVSAVPAETKLCTLELEGQQANVVLSEEYGRLQGLRRRLADYCITLTLTQLEGIRLVQLSWEHGSEAELLSADDVLFSADYAPREVVVQLYYLDESGELQPIEKNLVLYERESDVEKVLQALMTPPQDTQLCCALPEQLQIKDCYISGKDCYVDLPAASVNYLVESGLGQTGLLAMELSLRSLPGVEGVYFYENGETLSSTAFH